MKKTIGVLGAGTMGAGIAQVAAQSGHAVILVDSNSQQLEKAQVALGVILSKLFEKEKLSHHLRSIGKNYMKNITKFLKTTLLKIII